MAHYCHDRRQSRQAYKPREPEVCHATVDCRTRTIRCGFCALSANAFHLPCHSHSHACALFHRLPATTCMYHLIPTYTSPEFYFQRKSIRCFQFLCKRARPSPPARKHQQRQRQRLTPYSGTAYLPYLVLPTISSTNSAAVPSVHERAVQQPAQRLSCTTKIVPP